MPAINFNQIGQQYIIIAKWINKPLKNVLKNTLYNKMASKTCFLKKYQQYTFVMKLTPISIYKNLLAAIHI